MEKIAFISGEAFYYWSSIVLALSVVTAIVLFASVYIKKGGRIPALCLAIPLCLVSSLVLGRLVHWYCRTDAYESFWVAMTHYASGGYALMGAFAGCILTALVLWALHISDSFTQMLDSLAIGGGAGIAVGRLASLFNASDRGPAVPETLGLPFAYPVTNAVSGEVEYRLATFMLQGIFTAILVVGLLLYMAGTRKRKPLKNGDIFLLFLLFYGTSQIVFDSTRYDSLFMRSNGFISIVQILGAVGLVLPIVLFSIRMVKNTGMKGGYVALWVLMLAAIGGAGYMEYHVQRHGDQALFAYTIMTACLVVAVALSLVIWCICRKGKKQKYQPKFLKMG